MSMPTYGKSYNGEGKHWNHTTIMIEKFIERVKHDSVSLV
jgi:hypothetical protein